MLLIIKSALAALVLTGIAQQVYTNQRIRKSTFCGHCRRVMPRQKIVVLSTGGPGVCPGCAKKVCVAL